MSVRIGSVVSIYLGRIGVGIQQYNHPPKTMGINDKQGCKISTTEGFQKKIGITMNSGFSVEPRIKYKTSRRYRVAQYKEPNAP